MKPNRNFTVRKKDPRKHKKEKRLPAQISELDAQIKNKKKQLRRLL